MAEVTVKQLADVVGTPVERLLEQIKDAGLAADNADARISDEDKMQLLSYLRSQHGESQEGPSDEDIEALIARREKARADKNWAEADRVRDELTRLGIVLEDSAGGTLWRRS